MRAIRSKSVLACAVALLACACSPQPSTPLAEGSWRAWLDSPGGTLPFGLELHQGDAALEAFLVNGTERIPIPAIEVKGNRVRIRIDRYDSTIDAELSALTCASAADSVATCAKESGYLERGRADSRLAGPKGNLEIFLHLSAARGDER